MFFVLIIIFSISSIYASDINSTDTNTITLNDDNITQVSDLETNSSPDDDSSPLKENNTNQTELTSLMSTVYYNGNYKVILKDSNSSNVLKNKTVSFLINNINFNATTDDYGIATINLALNPNKYQITAYFEGDGEYTACNLTSSINILSTIEAENMEKYYKGATQFIATFFDSQGNPLADMDVVISVNGKSYTKRTNIYGIVSMSMPFKPGVYKVVSYNPSNEFYFTTTFKVLETVVAHDLHKFVGDGKKFKARFLTSNGKYLVKKYIKFKLKGKIYKVKTDANGIAKLSLKNLKKGTYKVVCYNKDGLSKTVVIKIYKNKAPTKLYTNFYTFYQNESKDIKVRFSTAIGGSSLSGNLIRFNINGATYYSTTDANGIANLKLPYLNTGLYTITYSYSGTKYFRSTSASNLVTIINTVATNMTVKSTTSFGQGSGTPFKVLVSAGGVPLPQKSVIFNIDGMKYIKTTDNNGIASLPIYLSVGNYTVNYTSPADSKVNESYGSCNISVFQRNSSSLIWVGETILKDSSQTFKMLLTDGENRAIPGMTVKLTVGGKTYTAVTSQDGFAIFKTTLAFGKYKVLVNFEGDNFNNGSSVSKYVLVKLSFFKNGVNQRTSASYSKKYLESSKNCKVGSKKLKALVKSITKGLTRKVDQAKAIFNYVRDTLGYAYYYNTKHGSAGTLKLKKGNCVDHAHLLIALYRTAGFKARYVHGTCTFNKMRSGHVWSQVLIGKTWICADPTSYKNSLGKINNWNTKTFNLQHKYVSLPF